MSSEKVGGGHVASSPADKYEQFLLCSILKNLCSQIYILSSIVDTCGCDWLEILVSRAIEGAEAPLGPETARAACAIISNACASQEVTSLLSRDPDWIFLLQKLANVDDVIVQRETARLMLQVATTDDVDGSPWRGVSFMRFLDAMHKQSSDSDTRKLLMRLKGNLSSSHLRVPKYANGVHLLHKKEGIEDRALFDVVFVHGITGHYQWTWGTESNSVETLSNVDEASEQSGAAEAGGLLPTLDAGARAVCWASDWLPKDTLIDRLMSISYEVHYTHWHGNANSIEDESRVLLDKLLLARVGSHRPVVFVTHRFATDLP